MKTSNENLKVSFYLKKNVSRNGLNPVMGRIAIGKDMVQFSCKLEANSALWDTRAGRMNGKSSHSRLVNREIDKINVAVNARYKELIATWGHTTAKDVKNAYHGISSSNETLLSIFREHNAEYRRRTGVNIAISTWRNYDNALTHLERFIRKKYHVSDLHLKQLNYSFIDNYDYYLRIDLKMKPGVIVHKIYSLRKMVDIATGRGIISLDPFADYTLERPVKIIGIVNLI